MKTQTAAIPNNYSLFRADYSDICRTTRQLLAFSFNCSFFTTIPDSLKLSVNYPKLD